jgi:phosphoglycerate dehydrogenase-like enzyme
MNTSDKVAVCSRSFSKNPALRSELLERYKNVTFNDAGLQLEGDSLIAFLRGHDKAITALERIDDAVLAQLPDLKVIGKYGVGLDMIDMAAMRRYGKRLGWIGGVNRRSVSEMVISFAVAMLRHFPAAQREVLSGTWRQHVGGLLSGRTVGIIGCGFIGKDLVELLQPWGCTLLAHDILDFPDFYRQFNVEPVALDEILRRSDVVTIHVPLDDSTRNILDAQRLGLMKSSAILINAARGGLVDEATLKSMLIEKRLAAAAFDVFAVEPPQDAELVNLPNFLVTPHIGGSAAEAILAMGRAAIDGLDQHAIP